MVLPRLKRLKKLNLSKQLSLILSVILIGGLAIGAPSVAILMNSKAENQISLQAQILLATTSAVRDYTNSQIRPYLSKNLENEFLPQTIPAYSAREVFENFRADRSWQDYYYKEATLNPTNLRDLADRFETKIVNRFRQEKSLEKLRGFREVDSGKLFYIAKPLAVTKPSCLECHGTPEAAPKSAIELYGTENGFGWKLNEIVAARIVYVPANKVFEKARKSFIRVMSIIIVMFVSTILTLNWWLNRSIVSPLNDMTRTAEAISKGDIEVKFKQNSQDEVGRLAKAFSLMRITLKITTNTIEELHKKLNRLDTFLEKINSD